MAGESGVGSSSPFRPGRRRTVWPLGPIVADWSRPSTKCCCWRDLQHKLINGDRFGEPRPDSRIELIGGGSGLAADDDDWNRGAAVLGEFPQHRTAIHHGHEPIKKDDIRTLNVD